MADASKILMTEGDAPGTPSSGTVILYPKSDHAFYFKGSDGTEKPLAGADGAPGSPGAGVTWRGAWNSGTTYVLYDAVEHGGSSYIANAGNLNKTPGVDVEWDLWTEKGDTGPTGLTGPEGPAGPTVGLATNISDGDTTHAPDGNSVFDALALKAPNVLTGYTSSPGTVAATDTVIQAIQKLNGNFDEVFGIAAYGVRWDTTQSSPTLTKGVVVNKMFVGTSYTSYPIQVQMKRCVKSAAGALLYYCDAANSIYKQNETTPLRSGTATSTSAGKILDTSASFITDGVAIGHWVHNTTDGIATQVTAVDSQTQLSIAMDIFASGKAYSVGTANPQADGAMMVEVPASQYIMCTDGNYKYFLISEKTFSFQKTDGTIITSAWHPWFLEGGVFRPYQYWGAVESVWWDATDSAYHNHDGSTVFSSGDKAVSIPGFQPITGNSRVDFRTLHSAFGAEYHTESYYADEFMTLLFITEYGTLNSQAALPGYTEGTWGYAATRRTGRTMLLGNMSGSIEPKIASGEVDYTLNTTYGIVAGEKIANSYRGVENIFGHIWKWLDGINLSERKIYLCNNPSAWAEDTATGYTDTGLYLPTDGYQTNFHSGLMLPSAASGGGSTTYVCDYLYSAAGWRALLSGGSLYHGAAAGAFCRLANGAGSDRVAHFGSRAAAV
ncbi:MAG: hypothetical protein V1844_09970 [Pseudomonadota bacterium]